MLKPYIICIYDFQENMIFQYKEGLDTALKEDKAFP